MSHDKQHGHGAVIATGIGMGVAAVAAAAAGAYYFYGSDKSARHQRKLKSWMLRMKAEVMDGIGDAKDFTEDTYNKVIDTVALKYEQLKDVDPQEVKDLATRMRTHWSEIKADVGETVKKEMGSK